MKTFKFGIMGPGKIAEKFANTITNGYAYGVEIVAVASSSSMAKANAFAAKYSIPIAYSSYEEMLNSQDIDAIYVATTNNLHFECCRQSILAGKHVLCEKPMVLTADHAKELERLAAEKGIFLMEAMWTRFLPAMQTAKMWLDHGRIGKAHCVSSSLCFMREPENYKRLYNPMLGGGALYDLGVYGLQFSQHMAGNRKLLNPHIAKTFSTDMVDISDYIHLTYEDDFVAEIKCSIAFHAKNDAYIIGERGYIHIESPFNKAQKIQLFACSHELKDEFACKFESGFEYEILHMVDCIRHGKLQSNIMPLAHTIELAEIMSGHKM